MPAVNHPGGELGGELGHHDEAGAFVQLVHLDRLGGRGDFHHWWEFDGSPVSEAFDGALHVVVTSVQQLGNLLAGHGGGMLGLRLLPKALQQRVRHRIDASPGANGLACSLN